MRLQGGLVGMKGNEPKVARHVMRGVRRPCVVSMYVGDMFGDMREALIQNKRDYCKAMNYTCKIYENVLKKESRPVAWQKLYALEDSMSACSRLMWVDGDAMFMGHKPMPNPAKEIMLASEKDGVNTGVMVMHSTSWVRGLLRRVSGMHSFDTHGQWEQAALNALLRRDGEISSHVERVDQRDLNSFDMRDAPFIYHTSGLKNKQGLWRKALKIKPAVVLMLTTHDRKGYVQTFSRWLKTDSYVQSGVVDLVVRDDASTAYGRAELKEWFPTAKILMSTRRYRSDKNIRLNFEWFTKSKYDLLVSIDSDSLLDPSWYTFLMSNFPSSGFASLYHSNARHHRTLHCNDGVWCHQTSTGSLGMVMSKELVVRMLVENKNNAFDWGIVGWLKNNDIPIRAPKRSMVLHFGYYGQNNSPTNMVELADSFNMSTIDVSVRPCVKWWMQKHKPDSFCIKSRFVIIIIADKQSQEKYKDNIENIKCYAEHYNYDVIVSDTHSSCKGHFFIKKHCTVRKILDMYTFEWALVLDGDVAVVNYQRKLDEFVHNNASVIHGIRFHNNEICACTYFIRNDEYGKKYLDDWVYSGYTGFNYDNGALHYILLDKIATGVPGKEECQHIGQQSRTLKEYDAFIKCFHKILSKSVCNEKIKIMENTEENPSWICIDTDRPNGKWTNISFLQHAMKPPYQLRPAPKCSQAYFQGGTDEFYIPPNQYKQTLKEFWSKNARRDTGWDYDICANIDYT